jgi:hypothetical protein
MITSVCSIHRGRIFVATLVFAAFFCTLLLSVAPTLHARVHDDGSRTDHVCAVTLITTGSYDHAAQPPLITAPQFTARFCKLGALRSTWVLPLFLSAHIFAHAPPAHS